jgi:hypothetical protein
VWAFERTITTGVPSTTHRSTWTPPVERRAGCDQLGGAGSASFLQARDDRYAFHRFLLSAAAAVGRDFIVSPRSRT